LWKEFFAVRTTKEGMSMGAMISLVLLLLIAVNYLGAKKYKTFDFSNSQVNSISDQSKKLVRSLNEDLKLIYFYKNGTQGVEDNRRAFTDLIRKYQDESSRVLLQFVELNENPKLAEEYGVSKGSGLVFLDYKGHRSKIEKIDEQELTGAIVKVTRDKDKKIYYVIGHRERDLDEPKEVTGAASLKKLLEGSRYSVNPLNLGSMPEIPADADMVMILGPEQEYLESELKVLQAYLKKGGSMILAMDAKRSLGLDQVLSPIGLSLGTEYLVQVMDTPMGKAVNPQVTAANQFSETSPITIPFGRGEFVVTRLPSPILKKETAGITFDELVKTDASTFGFPNTQFQGAAKTGPFAIATFAKGKYPGATDGHEFQILVLGDADIFSNQLLYRNLNRDLLLNTVSFLAKEENMISISPKEVSVTSMQITETQFYLFIFGFIIPLPLILIITSGVLWYRRRFA
jgi:ABC-type uncharacterized transport system involved in gliding motility auxiliary subunit